MLRGGPTSCNQVRSVDFSHSMEFKNAVWSMNFSPDSKPRSDALDRMCRLFWKPKHEKYFAISSLRSRIGS